MGDFESLPPREAILGAGDEGKELVMTVHRWIGAVSFLALATACGASQPPLGSAGPSGDHAANPFAGAAFFIDPDFVKKVDAAAAAAPADAALLKKVATFSTAVWLDSIEKTKEVTRYLDEAKKQEAAAGKPVVPVIILYDMPNRDCSAKASAGELAVEDGGENRYKTEYVDAIARQLRAHPDQRVVLVLEPDSLANLATNLGVAKCAASEKAYKASVAYAISTLSTPNVFIYLDAAHGGWLGWDSNRPKIAQIFKEVLTAAGGAEKVRGFALNVSNYNVIKAKSDPFDGGEGPCPDEMTYAQKLSEALAEVGIKDKGYLIDTSRNGRGGIRKKAGSWCNVHNAGLGERPRAAPAPLIDAYVWLKTPGESDGTSNASAARFDAMCKGPDAAADAPEAGQWFSAYFIALAKNATPPL
jgi:cellulose 1,4-beta-cellobiosidase